MDSRNLLIKQFRSYKIIEKSAEDRYSALIDKLIDKNIIKVLEKIKKDEQKHQKICEQIIIIIENSII